MDAILPENEKSEREDETKNDGEKAIFFYELEEKCYRPRGNTAFDAAEPIQKNTNPLGRFVEGAIEYFEPDNGRTPR